MKKQAWETEARTERAPEDQTARIMAKLLQQGPIGVSTPPTMLAKNHQSSFHHFCRRVCVIGPAQVTCLSLTGPQQGERRASPFRS